MIKNKESVFLVDKFSSKTEAIEFVGNKMIELGYVDKEYINSMIERDKTASVAIGNYLAIPHGNSDGFKYIKNSGILVVKLKESLTWDDEKVNWIVGLALVGDNQLEALQNLAIAFSEKSEVESMNKNLNTLDEIFNFFSDLESEQD